MAGSERWVRDTRFGTWLITSDVWVQHVLRVALAQLLQLLGARTRSYSAILDVGCGGGKALPILAEPFAPETLVGLDPDPDMIVRAGAIAAGCRCRLKLSVDQAPALGLADGPLALI